MKTDVVLYGIVLMTYMLYIIRRVYLDVCRIILLIRRKNSTYNQSKDKCSFKAEYPFTPKECFKPVYYRSIRFYKESVGEYDIKVYFCYDSLTELNELIRDFAKFHGHVRWKGGTLTKEAYLKNIETKNYFFINQVDKVYGDA